MTDSRSWRHFDWVLLIVVVLLVGFGVTMIYSATHNVQDTGVSDIATRRVSDSVTRQLLSALIGLAAMIGIAAIDYRIWGGMPRIVYLVALALLAIALVLGQSQVGAVRRWITFGAFDVQPAEIAKYLVILVLAQYLASHEEQMDRLPIVLGAIGLLALPTIMVLVQPNLSTAILLLVVGLIMILVAGIRWQYLAVLAAIGLGIVPVAWLVFHGYIEQEFAHVLPRLLVFAGLSSDPGVRFNLDQALTAIGSGGFVGKGFLNPSSLSQLHFLRVRHTDFIFSVIAEELGMLGVLLLFALFIWLLFRLLRIAAISRDGFGRYIAIGLAMMIFFQAAVNIAMNLSLVPVAGLPLPFISYGGSALVTLMSALGIVESVAMRHKKLEF
jgi:rod shape determining protein RodA